MANKIHAVVACNSLLLDGDFTAAEAMAAFDKWLAAIRTPTTTQAEVEALEARVRAMKTALGEAVADSASSTT